MSSLAHDIRSGAVTMTPWPHLSGCTCDVTQTYTCERCGRRFGHCIGAADDMPEACDYCWYERHAGEAAP